MTRKIMVPFLAAAAMLAGSAIASAQDSHPNDFLAADRAFSGPFYDTRYRVSPYQYPDVTTGYALEVETPMRGPIVIEPGYSSGVRVCTTWDMQRGLC
jgi:hypothetical protein